MEEPRVVFIEIPSMQKGRSGSLSPISPSPYRGKHTGFFDLLSRRFGRRSHDELFYHHHNGEEDERSSSTESCSSTSGQLAAPSRSLSCSSTPSKEPKPKKTKKTPPAPKRILRQPISYTYLKGMSGLPTQRVPRSSVCCQYTHR